MGLRGQGPKVYIYDLKWDMPMLGHVVLEGTHLELCHMEISLPNILCVHLSPSRFKREGDLFSHSFEEERTWWFVKDDTFSLWISLDKAIYVGT